MDDRRRIAIGVGVVLLVLVAVGAGVLLGEKVRPPFEDVPVGALGGGRAQTQKVTLAANLTVSTTEQDLGSQFEIIDYDTLILWIEYSKGTESSTWVTADWSFESAGTEFNEQVWSTTPGIRTIQTADSYTMTASGNHYITYDVSGIPFVQFKTDSHGTPSGAITVTYSAVKK